MITIPWFESVFEYLAFGVLVFDSKLQILFANKECRKYLKYSAKELLHLNILDISPANDITSTNKLIKNVNIAKKNTFSIKKKFILKNKKELCSDLKINPIIDKKSREKLFVAIIIPVKKTKSTSKNNASEINYLNILLENSPDQIYFKDLQSRFIRVSKAMSDKHSMPEEDLIGKTDFDLFGLEHAQSAFNDEQNIIKTGKRIVGKEEREDRKDGGVTWTSSSKLPLYDNKNNIIGTFGISRDITDKKRIDQRHEAILRISESVFNSSDMHSMFAIIHQVLTAIMVVDNIFFALYDESSNLLTFPYYVDQYDNPREACQPKKGLTEYVLRKGEAVLINIDKFKMLQDTGEVDIIGTPAKIWMGVPLKIAGKTIGVIVLQDYNNSETYSEPEMQFVSFIAEQIALVIERKKNAVKIAEYTEELQQLNATKDKFFSIIAHDLKNPFITIMGFVELLISDFDTLTDSEKLDFLKEMRSASENSHALLQNLLQWSRSQTGFIEFNPQKLNVFDIGTQNIDLMNTFAKRKGIELRINIPKDLFIYADADMLNTVIRNLLSNAIKFTQRKGEVILESIRNKDFIEIAIMDNGRGMNESTINELFKLNVKHTSRGTENESGSGLGLHLCKEFVNINGGQIWVESLPGQGSKFTFSMPAFKN